MTFADHRFKQIGLSIMRHGVSDEGMDVRPTWPDGEKAHTKSLFSVVTRYDLSKEFPILTIRNTAFKSSIEELLWIWQKKSNNVNDLRTRIWDAWASPEVHYNLLWSENDESAREQLAGQLTEDEISCISNELWYEHKGELFLNKEMFAKHLTYNGYEKNLFKDDKSLNEERLDYIIKEYLDNGKLKIVKVGEETDGLFPTVEKEVRNTIKKAYGYQLGIKHKYPEGEFDQVDKVLYDLKHNPSSRRIMTNIYNHADLNEMGLPPCAYSMTFSVKNGKLNAILNQRSQDFLTANNWNVVQYSVLVHMLAQVSDLEVGELVHVISDCHIYDRHESIVKELLAIKPRKGPKLVINKDIKDFYDFTIDDFKLVGYERNQKRYNIEVAE